MLSVFLIDDSVIVRDAVVALLSEVPGLTVVGQSCGVNAVEIVREMRPDVVILDLHLRREHGLEVLGRLRRLDGHPTVVIFTSEDYPQLQEKCLAEGADYFFSKAVDFSHVINILTPMISRDTQMERQTAKKPAVAAKHPAVKRTTGSASKRLSR